MFEEYNFRLKKFGNGTFQLSYYSKSLFLMESEKPEHESKIPLNFDFGEPYWELFEGESPFDDSIAIDSVPDRERSLASSLARTKKSIYDYGRSNCWEWFFTLTFNNAVPEERNDFELCSKRVRKWFNHIRERTCPNIKYLVIPEQHKQGGWHFHALVSNCDGLEFVEAKNNQEYLKDKNGNIKKNKKGQPVKNKYFGQTLKTSYPNGEIIFNVSNFHFGFSTATKIIDTKKATSYVVKYITKDLCSSTLGKRRYFASNNLNTPAINTGLVETPELLERLLQFIEYRYSVNLSTDATKAYQIQADNYKNTVTVFEFSDTNKKTLAEFSPEEIEFFENLFSAKIFKKSTRRKNE